MTRIIRTYLAHYGQASLWAECLAMAGVFALIGMAFAFPANAYGTGLSQVEPVPVSPLRASIPFAGEQL